MRYHTQGLVGYPLTHLPSSVAKTQPASAGLGHSYFWHLMTRAYACIPSFVAQMTTDHRYSIALGFFSSPGPSIGPGSNSGPMTGSASKATTSTFRITADWFWYY